MLSPITVTESSMMNNQFNLEKQSSAGFYIATL